MTQGQILLLCLGGLMLGVIAVVIDRLNFPQRKFRAKAFEVDLDEHETRDRTGAHIIDLGRSDAPPTTTTESSSEP